MKTWIKRAATMKEGEMEKNEKWGQMENEMIFSPITIVVSAWFT
jgi:hypothetical protein